MSVLSVLVSFLLNFDYTIPNATFEEDIDFLKDNTTSQRIGAISWITAGVFNLILLPFSLVLLQLIGLGMRIVHIVLMGWMIIYFKIT